MLVHDGVVRIHRALDDDASAIAEIHAAVEREQIRLARGPRVQHGVHIQPDQASWRRTLQLSSGDHRPWVATHGDRLVGFVSAGQSRDQAASSRTAEIYVFDVDFAVVDEPGARSLLGHACRDLLQHGFTDSTIWVGCRDERLLELLVDVGWKPDHARRFERVYGIPILQFRYRLTLA